MAETTFMHTDMAEPRSDRQPTSPRYTLRVPVRTLGKNPILDLESPVVFQIADLEVALQAAPPLLVTTVDGFISEAEAAEFVPRVITALYALVVRWNIAFRASFVPQQVTYASDPAGAGNNLARSFGAESGPAVDGLTGINDTVIFPSGKRLRWLTFGEGRGIVQTPASLALPVFTQAMSNVNAKELMGDEKFKTAIELFNASFYETSVRAKFLTIVMILEVLAPLTYKHTAAQALLEEWKKQIQIKLTVTSDNDTRLALEALDKELDFRRETSIRQRVRQLLRNEFEYLPQTEREELERQAVKVYDARSVLVHSGMLPQPDLAAYNEHGTRIVRRILSKRLGLEVES